MTFHDEVFHQNDEANYRSVRQLQLWLLTIGFVSSETTEQMLLAMEKFCNEMGWEMFEDSVLGRNILK